jgi:hypothetical protein
VQTVDVREGHLGDLEAFQLGQDPSIDHPAICGCGAGTVLPFGMLSEEPLGQVGNRFCVAIGLEVGQREARTRNFISNLNWTQKPARMDFETRDDFGMPPSVAP